MYTPQYAWNDAKEWADETAQLQADIAVEQARATRAQVQLDALQGGQPKGDLTAQLAAQLNEPIEQVRAKVAAVKAAAQGPQAGNPDRLSELLDKVDPNDYEGAVRAFDQAGYQTIDAVGQTWQHGRLQRASDPKGSTAEIYAYLDGATSLEDYQARLASAGLLENGAA